MITRRHRERIPPKLRESVRFQVKYRLASRSSHSREEGVVALGEIKHKSVIPYLAKALKDREHTVRAAAVNALGETNHPNAIPHLIKAFRDGHIFIGRRAAEVLLKFKHEQVIPYALDALQSRKEVAREHAASLLAEIGQAIQDKEVEGKKAKAFQLVGEHFREDEEPETIRKAYLAALKGKITPANARLYIKQLRAMKGNVK